MDAVASVGLRTRVWVCMCAKMVNTRTPAQEVCRQGAGECWAARVGPRVLCGQLPVRRQSHRRNASVSW